MTTIVGNNGRITTVVTVISPQKQRGIEYNILGGKSCIKNIYTTKVYKEEKGRFRKHRSRSCKIDCPDP
jgi:hypothetical protein